MENRTEKKYYVTPEVCLQEVGPASVIADSLRIDNTGVVDTQSGQFIHGRRGAWGDFWVDDED